MRIKKMYQGTAPENKIVGTYIESNTDTYNCNYANEHFGGVVLYNNISGTTGNITLSDNISNYSYLEIFYTSSGYGSSKKIDLSLSNTFILNLPFIYNNAYYDRMSKYSVANNKITFNSNLTINSNFAQVATGNAEILIKKVIGYK